MTSREPHAPHSTLPATPPAAAPAPLHPDAAHEGNGPLMIATIAPPPPQCPTHAPDERGRAWLDRLFAGGFSFPTAPAVALPPGERTPAEYDAVARAAGCRDLFVIHADADAGERVIVDLARAVADRTLILTPDAASADRITERLLKHGTPTLRALADDENPARPSPAVSRFTSQAVGRASVEQARNEAAAAVTAAEERIAAFAVVAKALARQTEVDELRTRLDAHLAELTARRNRIESDLKAEHDTPFAVAVARLQSEHEGEFTRLATDLQAVTVPHAEREAALAAARQHHAEATRKPGFLARFFGGKPKGAASDTTELERQVHSLETETAELAARAGELQASRDAAANAFATEREKLTAAELASRRAAIDEAIAAAESERERARAEYAALRTVIGEAVPGDDHALAERRLAVARQQAAEVAAHAPELAARAVAAHRVVVALPAAIEVDPVFAAIANDPPFDLLVLDRAEELPESEFSRLARLADRWVLVGEAAMQDEVRFPNARRHAAEVPFVARLAKWLDRETWGAESDRLVCRLATLTPDQRRSLTREPLADRPEVELRFADVGGEPLLAEIVFPAAAAAHEAKAFLFHTLGEVLLRPCGELTWENNDATVLATWSVTGNCSCQWVELMPGVREKVAGCGPSAFTAAVSFDRAAGWDAERAAEWLASHLPPASSRFAALPRTSSIYRSSHS